MEDVSKYWPISAAATAMVFLGYAIEFVRLCAERTSSGVGLFMWIIWTSSAALSVLYAWLSGASPLIVINSCAILFLTLFTALANKYVARRFQ